VDHFEQAAAEAAEHGAQEGPKGNFEKLSGDHNVEIRNVDDAPHLMQDLSKSSPEPEGSSDHVSNPEEEQSIG
jgi:hypothetical protein